MADAEAKAETAAVDSKEEADATASSEPPAAEDSKDTASPEQAEATPAAAPAAEEGATAEETKVEEAAAAAAEEAPPAPEAENSQTEAAADKTVIEEAGEEAAPGANPEDDLPSQVGSVTTASSSKRGSALRSGFNFLKDKSKAISESDRVQQLKAKTEDIAGSVKNKTKGLADPMVKSVSAKVANLRAGKGGENAAAALQSSQEALGPNAWKGSAKDTLSTTLEGEQWADVKILAAEEVSVSSRGEHIASHFVEKGSRLQWSFRIKEHSLNFAVRIRAQGGEDGAEEEVLQQPNCGAGQTMSCRWMADEDLSVRLIFDNKSSMWKAKTIAYVVGIGPATGAAGSEDAAEAAQEGEAASSSQGPTPALEDGATPAVEQSVEDKAAEQAS
mmetsp:Transcript_22888/g.53568  ORF Transcript_22888/g.53568 Transcript_22888/m.53568 type:complete len:389 (-) Transcript_22888:38-1204(-)